MLGAVFGLSILGFLIGVENRYLTLIQLFWYVFGGVGGEIIQVNAER